ncbi:MAG: TerB family tellurite resistance protein [Pseudomonadales bacterium]|nr:TerB family tellurite resistance protein [Pseudomonadales bacterium]
MLGKLLQRLRAPAEEPDPAQLTTLAAAALLLEVAWADHEVTEAELDLIRTALKRTFGLDQAAVEELVEESRRDHAASVGVQQYTRVINSVWGEPERFALVQALWELAFANDELHRYEEHTIRRIADLLYLSHPRFIEAKLNAKRTG